MIRKSNDRGSMIVEAAIFLPVFIIGIVSLLYIIKLLWINEIIVSTMSTESKKIAVETYTYKTGVGALKDASSEGIGAGDANSSQSNSLEASGETSQDSGIDEEGNTGSMIGEAAGAVLLQLKLSSAIRDADFDNDCSVRVCDYNYLFAESGMSDLINISVRCEVEPDLPIGIINEIRLNSCMLFRAWTGEETGSSPMGFDRMGTDEKSEIVYIFPYSGKKYHKLSCSYVSVYPEKTLLTQSLRKRYSPCALCDSSEVPEGETVYCFSGSGRVYHKAGCTAVRKYVEKIEKKDAEANGYSPCSKCGG